MFKRMVSLAVVLLLSVTLGCTHSQKWMAGGAVFGATVGGIWGSENPVKFGMGAIWGGVTGMAAGGLIGSLFDAREMSEMRQEIDNLKNENAKLKAELEDANRKLADANRRIGELEAELAKLKEELAKARVPMLEINLAADLLFHSGSARLTTKGKAALDDAAGKINAQYKDKFIMIEGHTDSQPIKYSHWKSNWELGAARSLTVLHYLNHKGVDASMLSAATFSKYQPVAGNDNKAGRAQNRRAVIVVYSNWPHNAAAK
jgi:chemotaxis protein MotB